MCTFREKRVENHEKIIKTNSMFLVNQQRKNEENFRDDEEVMEVMRVEISRQMFFLFPSENE
jgi:hypothetical protein